MALRGKQPEEAIQENDMLSSIKLIQEKISDIERKLDTSQEERRSEHPTMWSEAVTRMKPKPQGNSNNAPEDMMVGCMRRAMEAKDRAEQEQEERAFNIVLFKAPESTSEDRKERIEQDTKIIINLLTKLDLQEDVQFERVVRLGKKEADKNRPLRFRVKTLDQKAEVMDNLNMLREAEAPLNEIAVCHDLTPEQRNERRELVTQAKQLSDDCEKNGKPFLYRVRSKPGPYWDPEIKKISKTRRQ
jgi:hypothetical protein